MMAPVSTTPFIYQDPSYASYQAQGVHPSYAAYYSAYGMPATQTIPTTAPVVLEVPEEKLIIPKSEVTTYKKKIEVSVIDNIEVIVKLFLLC